MVSGLAYWRSNCLFELQFRAPIEHLCRDYLAKMGGFCDSLLCWPHSGRGLWIVGTSIALDHSRSVDALYRVKEVSDVQHDADPPKRLLQGGFLPFSGGTQEPR